MANPIQQVDKILAIWNEHLEVAKALPTLASAVSSAVDLMYSSHGRRGPVARRRERWISSRRTAHRCRTHGAILPGAAPFRALALHVNSSSLTAIGNDYGYEHVFAREVTAHARPGDVLLAISTSGNSVNILRAIEAARKCKVARHRPYGRNWRQDASGCDICLCVPTKSTPRMQEMHITIGHTICELLEERLASA